MNTAHRLQIVLAACVLAQGCASRAPVPQTPAAVPATATAPAPPISIADARRLGYTLVTQDGEELYCRTQPKTGSRIARETVCLTAKEIQKLGEETRRQISDMSRRTTPPPSR